MRRLIPIVFLAVLLAQACGLSTSQVKHGYEINALVKDEIDNLNIKLFDALKAGNFSRFRSLLGDSLAEKFRTKTARETWKLISSTAQGRSYDVLDEFYIRSLIPGSKVTLVSGDGLDEFTYTFRVPARESHVSFITLRDDVSQFLLTVIYGKFMGKWQVNGLYLDIYSVFGKTAPEYYEKADDLYLNKFRIDALIAIKTCNKCRHTSDTFFHYTHQYEIDTFSKMLTADVKRKYQLPYTLAKIKSQPRILDVAPIIFHKKIVPCVTYLTNTRLDDSMGLKEENKAVQRAVDDLFYGFKHNNPCIYYRAYNQMPEDKKETPGYDFVELSSQ